jgi:tRNA threonylcarbamoyl adenosine modification protein YjeE|tara:strand:+ start:485 stop:961 length:477 start_codon:yes stop_codon:yes gene_type:complete
MHIATKGSKLDISLESDTANLAKKFSKFLKKGDVLFLYGEIGVGKTTFIRYLINNLQISHKVPLSEVPSPTFNILNEYEIKNLTIKHYDLFRIKNINEGQNIGLLESKADAINLIEWPEKIVNKPKDTIDLIFEYDENLDKRFIIISGPKVINLNGFR